MGDRKEMEDIEELQAFRRKISDGVDQNLHEGIAKLNDAVSMFGDLQEICSGLFGRVAELESQNEKLEREIRQKTEYAERMGRKEEEYGNLEINAVKVVSLLKSLERKNNALDEKAAGLKAEKAAFEKVKLDLESAKQEAERKAGKYKEDRDKALSGLDTAIAEKRESESENQRLRKEMERRRQESESEIGRLEERLKECGRNAEAEIGGLRQRLEECRQNAEKEREEFEGRLEEYKLEAEEALKLIDWYKGYAESLDQKVIDSYEDKNDALSRHYFEYLNNSEKWDEHRKYFPGFRKEEDLPRIQANKTSVKIDGGIKSVGKEKRSQAVPKEEDDGWPWNDSI